MSSKTVKAAPLQHHSALTIKHNGRSNRIITEVMLSPAFDPVVTQEPPAPWYTTKALWDTGATSSVITDVSARAMGLIPCGLTLMRHARGETEANLYLVNFVILPNNVMVPGVQVVEGTEIGGDFGAIIGMDIITQGDFTITNSNNMTWMSFRIPSIQAIDYVIEANRMMFSGTNRNAPCPCNSGKKYKQCHGKTLSE